MSEIDISALSFDQYQRYTTVAQIADLVKIHLHRSSLQVLDVGGFFRTVQGNGILPLSHFLPQDRIVAVDLVPESLPHYILSVGQALPFRDRDFDVVVSCDTLEHVPQDDRLKFVDELLRVARHYLVLTAPFDNEATRLAELIVREYITARGLEHPQFREHERLGLPDADVVRASLHDHGLAFVDFADGYLHHWLLMMLIKHTPGQSLDFYLGLDRYYNRYLSPTDRREPAYRRVFVIAQPGNSELLPVIADRFGPVDSEHLSSFDFATTLFHVLGQAQTFLASNTQRSMENELERLSSELAAARAENHNLRQLVTAYEQGRFMRFMRQAARWRNRLGL